MRAWEIPNWQNKKLRVKSWNSKTFCKLDGIPGIWLIVSQGKALCFNEAAPLFLELMNSCGVEEYTEDKKEDIKVEKRCETCKYAFTSEEVCDTCTRDQTKRTDNWSPKLPAKTKDLTWQEAYEAWQDGWDAQRPGGVGNDYRIADWDKWQWATSDIVATDWFIKGKR